MEQKATHRLVPQALKGAEFASTTHSATPDAGTPYSRVLEPSYWALVASNLRPMDEIKVIPQDLAYYAHLLVVSVSRMDVFVKEISKADFEPVKTEETDLGDYVIKYSGPIAKHRVIRTKDGQVMAENISTKEEARRWIAEHEKAIAA
ncbi:MAG: hypothetical protein RL651_1781 [Pseudomonadota bacterium]|jgi:hypothetical protein